MTIFVGALLVLGIAVGLIGLGVAVWSFIDTRKRYYDEFLQRKKRRVGD